MEGLFSPCTRYRDLVESQGGRVPPDGLRELNLDASTEEFLSAEMGFTYAEVYAMLGGEKTIAWLTPHAFVVSANTRGVYSMEESRHFLFSADGKDIFFLARSPEHLLEICNVVLRLLAASVVHSVILYARSSFHGVLINAPTLAYLMEEQCQSLKSLSLKHLEMDENHCRVLGTYSRPGLEIELIHCKLTRADQA
jgi:hypothetical protein